MRARHIVSTVAIAGGLLIAPALPSQAAPTGGCAPTQNSPVLTMTPPASVRGVAAGAVAGSVQQNSWGLRRAKIHLQTRPLVNGKPAGAWKTAAVATTGAAGLWKASLAPGHNVRVRAFFPKAGAFPSVFSSVQTLMDAIRITMHATTPGACKI